MWWDTLLLWKCFCKEWSLTLNVQALQKGYVERARDLGEELEPGISHVSCKAKQNSSFQLGAARLLELGQSGNEVCWWCSVKEKRVSEGVKKIAVYFWESSVKGVGGRMDGSGASHWETGSIFIAVCSAQLASKGKNLHQQGTAPFWQLFLNGECLCPLSECPGMDILSICY